MKFLFGLYLIAGLLGQPQDSLVFARLDAMLQRYTEAISMESLDVKKAESDFLIRSVYTLIPHFLLTFARSPHTTLVGRIPPL